MKGLWLTADSTLGRDTLSSLQPGGHPRGGQLPGRREKGTLPARLTDTWAPGTVHSVQEPTEKRARIQRPAQRVLAALPGPAGPDPGQALGTAPWYSSPRPPRPGSPVSVWSG